MFNNHLLFMTKRVSNGIYASLVLTFFHIVLTVDKNKGDIKRNVCMDSVELGRADGHLSRKMTIA